MLEPQDFANVLRAGIGQFKSERRLLEKEEHAWIDGIRVAINLLEGAYGDGTKPHADVLAGVMNHAKELMNLESTEDLGKL